ncbi:DUF5947 family protein, partial [Streptomyces sp. NPDC005921]
MSSRTSRSLKVCAAPVSADHSHLYDTGQAEVRCACRPCSVLF